MTTPQKAFASTYKSASVQTASPGQLVLMLYDGALRFMTQAQEGFVIQNTRERNEAINNNLIKAQNILAELQSSLDMKVEGEFPKTMFRLYDFMIRQLQSANIRKEAEPIKVVYGMLKDIRDAWEEMLKKNDTKSAEEKAKAIAAETPKDAPADKDAKVGGGLNASA